MVEIQFELKLEFRLISWKNDHVTNRIVPATRRTNIRQQTVSGWLSIVVRGACLRISSSSTSFAQQRADCKRGVEHGVERKFGPNGSALATLWNSNIFNTITFKHTNANVTIKVIVSVALRSVYFFRVFGSLAADNATSDPLELRRRLPHTQACRVTGAVFIRLSSIQQHKQRQLTRRGRHVVRRSTGGRSGFE